MDDEKIQVEAMAKVIARTEMIARDAHCGYPSPTMFAKDLYWHGYRKPREGKWEPPIKAFPYYDYRCSECGCEEYRHTDSNGKVRMMNFCPNCGAKMKGGAE